MSSFNPATMNPAAIVLNKTEDSANNGLLLVIIILIIIIFMINK